MFKKSLGERFSEIFGIEKVSFALPDPEAKEQECIFVEIENSRNTIRDGLAISKVSGNGMIVGRAEKVPFGFISKAIRRNPDLTKDLFFFDFETNTKIYGDIIQMGFSFVYFFNEQYDPQIDKIAGLTVIEEQPE